MADYVYLLEEHKDMMLDFFALLSSLRISNKYKDLCQKYDFQYDVRISDAYYRLSIADKRWNAGFDMYFTSKPDRGMNLFDSLFLADIDKFASGTDLIKAIDDLEPMDIIFATLRFYDSHNNFTDRFYEELITKSGPFMSYMNGLDTTTDIRWEIMTLVQNPEDLTDKFKTYVTKMYTEFTIEYTNLRKQRDELRAQIDSAIKSGTVSRAVIAFETKEEDEQKTHVFTRDILPPTHELRIAALLFSPCKMNKVDTMRGTYYTMGVGYVNYFEDSMEYADIGDLELKTIFRAFTDPTRSQIIDALSEKECYNGELSKMVHVPMSSLTHHMDILNSSGFVLKRVEGKRTYYKINKKQFVYAANLLRRYAEGNEN